MIAVVPEPRPWWRAVRLDTVLIVAGFMLVCAGLGVMLTALLVMLNH